MAWSLPFKVLGKALKGLAKAIKRGLSAAVIKAATELVAEAVVKFATNEERRKWVIERLMEQFGIPESVARIAVELAVSLLKKDKP